LDLGERPVGEPGLNPNRLELSGGVRYTNEAKVNTISIPYVHAVLQALGFVGNGFYSGPITFDENGNGIRYPTLYHQSFPAPPLGGRGGRGQGPGGN